MIAKNHCLLTVLVSFKRCGPGWFWVVYLYWGFTAKAVFINSAGKRRLSSVWSSLQRYNEKGVVNIPVQSQSHHADYGLPSGYIQLYHVSHVQTQHRFASNCFYNNLFPFLTIMFRGGCNSLRKILLQVKFSRKSKFLRTFFMKTGQGYLHRYVLAKPKRWTLFFGVCTKRQQFGLKQSDIYEVLYRMNCIAFYSQW